MTSKKSDRPIVTFRATSEDKQRIKDIAKRSGLSQQEYLLKVALLGLPSESNSTPQTSDSALLSTLASQQETISSQQETIKQLSEKLSTLYFDSNSKPEKEGTLGFSDSTYKVGVCVKGREASDVLEAAKPYRTSRLAPKTPLKYVLAYDLLWRVEKTSNGNGHILTAKAEVPKELQNILDIHMPPSDLLEVLRRYKKFTELEGWELLSDKDREYVARMCNDRWSNKRAIDDLLRDTQEDIAKLQADTEETPPHPPVETVDSIPKTKASYPGQTTPLSQEPVEPSATEGLLRDDFLGRYGLAFNGNSYSRAVAEQKSAGYWAAPDGEHWKIASGKGAKTRWVTVTLEHL